MIIKFNCYNTLVQMRFIISLRNILIINFTNIKRIFLLNYLDISQN